MRGVGFRASEQAWHSGERFVRQASCDFSCGCRICSHPQASDRTSGDSAGRPKPLGATSVSEDNSGQVRRYASHSYLKWCSDAEEAIRTHIKQEGYSARDLHQRMPSIRAGVLTDFVKGKGEYGQRGLINIAEAAGLELEPPRFRKRPSMAPRRDPHAPKHVWGQAHGFAWPLPHAGSELRSQAGRPRHVGRGLGRIRCRACLRDRASLRLRDHQAGARVGRSKGCLQGARWRAAASDDPSKPGHLPNPGADRSLKGRRPRDVGGWHGRPRGRAGLRGRSCLRPHDHQASTPSRRSTTTTFLRRLSATRTSATGSR